MNARAEQHRSVPKAFVAGFIATLVLSMMMVVKSMFGLMPQLDVIAMLSGMLGVSLVGAWVVHFLVGTVGYGIAIALLSRTRPSPEVVSGLILSVIGWLIMMLGMMPMAGKGLFGMQIGIMAPLMTLMLHLIFGAILGWVYGKMTGHQSAPSHTR
ncbi:DUF6789 family protein [Stutzerimonas stutzeri]|jgi:hypothetical protein|uniref:DUF1440 domain-containing protein n=1 Tax=Stutzerimonas stutzeri TaxID=316 RepID=A0A172WK30_STUST|nr:DUF6789 family protein [Stutzerimonas stutzeri]ANF23822.1 hypothetical protein PS273GM_01025 [Stutzerimonas stutzeri]